MDVKLIKAAINKHQTSKMHINQRKWLQWYQGNEVRPKQKSGVPSLNMVKVVSYEMASLIMNENVRISFSDDQAKNIINDDIGLKGFQSLLQHKLEQMFALGGLGAEVINTEFGIEFNFIRGDRVIPLRFKANGDIQAIAFIIEKSVIGNDGEKELYTLVRVHEYMPYVEGQENYTISNKLFKRDMDNDVDDLGEEVELSELYDDLVPEYRLEAETPLFAYVRPNIANNIDLDTPLGMSIIGNSESTLAAIDLFYDSFCYEFAIGRKKLVIPDFWLERNKDGQLIMPDDMDYLVATKQSSDEGSVVDININLRVDEHIEGLNKQMDLLANQTGFDIGTFSFQDGQVKTATEVISQKSRTFKTKKSHETLITFFIDTLMRGALWLHFSLEGSTLTRKQIKELEISVDYDDSIVEDTGAELNSTIIKFNNRLIPHVTAIALANKVTEEEAVEIKKKIDEDELLVPEVVDLIGKEG